MTGSTTGATSGEIADILAEIAREAGEALLALQTDTRVVARRTSGDLTLAADERAQELILRRLERALPGLAIVAEEGDDCDRALPPTFLSVDPLDGTIPYSLSCPDWGVNLGYVEAGRPVAGAIYLPATGQLLRVDVARGIYLGDRPVAPKRSPQERFVLGLDLHYATDPAFVRSVLAPLIPQVRLTRSLGSTAALTVDFALGRTDAHLNLRGGGIWDIVTLGAVAAAGNFPVTDLSGRPRDWRDRTTAILTGRSAEVLARILPLTQAFVAGNEDR